MIDHVGFAVSNYERAKEFYAKALAPLGYKLIMEVPAETNHSGFPAAGFGADGKPDFWIGGEGRLEHPLHVAIVATAFVGVPFLQQDIVVEEPPVFLEIPVVDEITAAPPPPAFTPRSFPTAQCTPCIARRAITPPARRATS